MALDPLHPGFHVGRGGKLSGVRFEIRGETQQFPSSGDGAMLALRGAERALWSCQLRLPAAKLGEPGALDELDAGIRYFYPAASDRIGSWRFPIFDVRTRAIVLDATLIPTIRSACVRR